MSRDISRASATARSIQTTNAYLEYRTPFEFTGRTDAIVPELIKYAGWDADRSFGADCIAAKPVERVAGQIGQT